MTIAQAIARQVETADTRGRAGEFVNLCRCRAMAEFTKQPPAKVAAQQGLTQRVQKILSDPNVLVVKAAVAPMQLPQAVLADYESVAAGFLETLRNVGCFDRILADGGWRQVPMRTRVVVVTVGASAGALGEPVSLTPLTSLLLANQNLALRIATTAVILSNELWRAADAEAQALVQRELSSGAALVTDQQMVAELTGGITAMTSNGATATAIQQDFARLFGAVTLGQNSRPYILMQSHNAKALATKDAPTTFEVLFPTMGPMGGTIANVPVLVCDGLSAGQIVLVDAAQVAAASAPDLAIDTVRQGDVQLDTAPDSPPLTTTVLTSMWQHNLTGLRVMRRFGIERLTTTAVAVLSGANYATSNSPP